MSFVEYRLIKQLQNHQGLKKAIRGEDLAKAIHLKGTRDLRDVVAEARKNHQPVMSLPGVGYWFPKEWGEDETHCVNHLRDMGREFFRDAEMVEKGLLELYGDPKMF